MALMFSGIVSNVMVVYITNVVPTAPDVLGVGVGVGWGRIITNVNGCPQVKRHGCFHVAT